MEAEADVQVQRRRTPLWLDLTLFGVIGAVLLGALYAGAVALYRELYSPTAFVERYLSLLVDGDAARALAVPGVTVDSADLDAADLPAQASDALLRSAALSPLSDVEVVSENTEGDITTVTVSYRAGAYVGTTSFEVVGNGWIGVAPAWRFAQSPLAVIDLVVKGSTDFDVNGFTIDKRQIDPEGVAEDPLTPLPLLVFSPGLYSVSVDNAIARTPGVAVLSDSPFAEVPVQVQAQPTDEFVALVQSRVTEFLAECATQQVLQPTGCPFGYVVQDRIGSPPEWTISTQPEVVLTPDGDAWRIAPTVAAARIRVDIVSLFDGSVRPVDEDVRFEVSGTVTVLPDGSASIIVSGA
ncbi:hypothetical protein GCM10022200_21910 [Microbacterium awajiense]|uniref:Uncharacterized protein n=1 Tax=Microbacterium awajiense TaxID=415214 RepID=A0ABP7AQC5_9MICO